MFSRTIVQRQLLLSYMNEPQKVNNIRLYNLFRPHWTTVKCASFNEDGSLVEIGYDFGGVEVWNCWFYSLAHQCGTRHENAHDNTITCVDFFPNKRRNEISYKHWVLSCCMDNKVKIWNCKTDKLISQYTMVDEHHINNCEFYKYNNKYPWILCCSYQNITIINYKSDSKIFKICLNDNNIIFSKFHPLYCNIVITYGLDKCIKIYDISLKINNINDNNTSNIALNECKLVTKVN